jgi:hypothetical protein
VSYVSWLINLLFRKAESESELWFADSRWGQMPCQLCVSRDRFRGDEGPKGQAMTRFTRKASLLLVFSQLISAATAYAECAWVLWSHNYFRAERVPDSTQDS